MKKRCIRGAALVLALLVTLSLRVPAFAVDSSDTAAAAASTVQTTAQAAAQTAAQYGQAASLSYAVCQNGKNLVSGAVNLRQGTEQDGDLYGIGSVSKIYTTVAVMQLAEARKIRLDAPVTTYLPDFQMADGRYRQITVRMLLNHSSGLMGSSTNNSFLFDDPDRSATEDLLNRLSTQRLKADPGAYSVYCNDGFTLAELIVEAVSGKTFPEYLRENVLTPLGLTSTATPQDNFDAARLARTYASTSDSRPLPQETLGIVGTGGIYASADDLAAFGEALTGSALLQRSSLNAMASPEYRKGIWPEDDLDMLAFGLGWDLVKTFPFCQSGIQVLVKGGDTYQYHAALAVIPAYGLSCAVLSSGGSSYYNELAAFRMLIDVLKEQGVTVDETVPALPAAERVTMPAALTEESGYYGGAQRIRVEITTDGTLKIYSLDYPSIPPQAFTYYSDGTFRDSSAQTYVQPVRERNGQTYLYQKAFTAVPGLGTLPTSNYLAVKLPENPISPELQKTWDTALSQSYLPMNAKYSSQLYLMLSTMSEMGAVSSSAQMIPGYAGSCRIQDAAQALYVPQVPGLSGRDGSDVALIQKNGVDWMETGGVLYMPQSSAAFIFTDGGWSYSTIQPDGCARWYQVGAAAGKTMAVHAEKNGSGGFYVYNAKGILTASSVLWGDTSAVLPQGGLIVFAGGAGDRFHLRFTVGR